MGEETLAGMYILEGARDSIFEPCRDSCQYVKVGDTKQDKFCFSEGDMEVACHRDIPSLTDLRSLHATRKARPVLIVETFYHDKPVEGMYGEQACSAWEGMCVGKKCSGVEEINGGRTCSAWEEKTSSECKEKTCSAWEENICLAWEEKKCLAWNEKTCSAWEEKTCSAWKENTCSAWEDKTCLEKTCSELKEKSWEEKTCSAREEITCSAWEEKTCLAWEEKKCSAWNEKTCSASEENTCSAWKENTCSAMCGGKSYPMLEGLNGGTKSSELVGIHERKKETRSGKETCSALEGKYGTPYLIDNNVSVGNKENKTKITNKNTLETNHLNKNIQLTIPKHTETERYDNKNISEHNEEKVEKITKNVTRIYLSNKGIQELLNKKVYDLIIKKQENSTKPTEKLSTEALSVLNAGRKILPKAVFNGCKFP